MMDLNILTQRQNPTSNHMFCVRTHTYTHTKRKNKQIKNILSRMAWVKRRGGESHTILT